MFILRKLMVYSLAVALFAAAAIAQRTGVIQGTVTDESGAVIPGANVSVIAPNGVEKKAGTDASGSYSVVGLAPGTYTVRVLTTGFAKFEKAVSISAAQTITVDAPLKIQLANQEVTVQSEAVNTVSVDPSQNAGAIVLKGEDLAALSDDPDDLADDLQALAGPSAGPNGGQIFVDGFSGARLPPKESIREIRINSNPFAAEYDRLGFGRIEILTKPGTDKFHGTAYFNYSNGIFNSRNPFSFNKPDFESKSYGGNFGGPINKRSSFFVDFEKRDIDDNAIVNATTLDSNLNPTTIAQGYVTPHRRYSIVPRIDYALNQNNTLVVRYNYTNMDNQNTGIGDLTLLSRAANSITGEHTVQVTETAVLGAKAVNETRLQFMRMENDQLGLNIGQPSINVAGSFNGGGSTLGNEYTTQDRWEINNTTSLALGRHSVKFGGRVRTGSLADYSPTNYYGTFTFAADPRNPGLSSLDIYRQTLLLLQQGVSPADIRARGLGASQFSIAGGNPLADVRQTDLGVFVQDDWRAAPNLTVSYGLRYETQTNIHDRSDFGPRIGIAWAPGGKNGRNGKTVVRAGFGMFYDRFADTLYLQSLRYNGVNQLQYTVRYPDFFPNVPTLSALGGSSTAAQTLRYVDKGLRSPYLMQSVIGIERQLPRSTTVAVTYTHTRGLHELRSVSLSNASARIYSYESTGKMDQNQLITNVSTRFSRRVTLFSFYALNKVKSDTDGAGSFPSNPLNYALDYGRAGYDIRHRFVLGGSITAPWSIRLNPFIMASSGAPFNITNGLDTNGDFVFNERPALVDPATPGAKITPYGAFLAQPLPGMNAIARNFGEGPGQFTVNLRLSKTFGWGERNTSAASNQGGPGGPGGPGGFGGGPVMRGGGGVRGGGGGGGMRGGGGMFGGDSSGKKYSLTFSVNARNVLNHVNPGLPIGDLSSPRFGESTQLAGGFGPDRAAANNRRLEFMLRFSF